MYEADVHYNLTHALAAAAGFSMADAATIASANVHVDLDAATQPMPSGRVLGSNLLGKGLDIVSGDNYQRLRDWHFVTSRRLQELENIWRSSGSLVSLGMYMHALQDSYSHQGFGPGTGQAGSGVTKDGEVEYTINWDRWHEVDDPSKRPGHAVQMAKRSYDILVEAAELFSKKRTIRQKFPATGWGFLNADVSKFCHEKNEYTRKSIAGAIVRAVRQWQRSPREAVGSARASIGL